MCNSADNTAPSLLVPRAWAAAGNTYFQSLLPPVRRNFCLRLWRPATGVSEPARNLSKTSDRQQRSDLSHIKEKRRLTDHRQVR